MRNIVKGLILAIIVYGLLMTFYSCNETTVSVAKGVYDPVLVLSGDVEELTRIRLVEEGSENTSRDCIELSDIVSRVRTVGELDGIMILSHGNKAIYINSDSISKYYFAVTSFGVISLYSRLESLSDIADLPLNSVGELVFCAKEPTDRCIKRVYKEHNDLISHNVLFRAFGLFTSAPTAIDSAHYSITPFNKSAVKLSAFLNGEKSGHVELNDGRIIDFDSDSKYSVYWNNGGLCLTEKEYRLSHIVKIIID